MKRKHYDCIVAWANGAEIEYKSILDGEWIKANDAPHWFEDTEYRIANPKKRTQTQWLWADEYGEIMQNMSPIPLGRYNIKLEWSATEFEVEE